MSHPAAAADAAHSSTDAGVPRLVPWSLPSHDAFSYRRVACVSDAAVCWRTGAGVGAGTGAGEGCLVFLVRFALATAHKRQRARCGRIISNEAAEMTRLAACKLCWQSHQTFCLFSFGLDAEHFPGAD